MILDTVILDHDIVVLDYDIVNTISNLLITATASEYNGIVYVVHVMNYFFSPKSSFLPQKFLGLFFIMKMTGSAYLEENCF